MAVEITQEIVDDFASKIGFVRGRLAQYFDKYFDFTENNYPFIVNFFSGKTEELSPEHFMILFELIDESEQISQAISERDYLLTMFLDWELVEYVEDLKSELFRIVKTSKFLRSSKTNFNFTGSIEFNHVLGQNQTLENVSRDVLLSTNEQDDWVEIAQRNDLEELDYTAEGGNPLILKVNLASRNVDVVGVIDNITGEKVHGLDIQKKLEFVDDDLLVLGHDDTIKQAVEILTNLIRGDIPEFPSFGRGKFVGKSSAILGFSSLILDMVEVFSSDDTLVRFLIEDAELSGSDFKLKLSVSTRLGELIKQNIIV